LQERVEETRERGTCGLLDNLCTSFTRIVLGGNCAVSEKITRVFGRVLVGGASDELETVEWYAEGPEDGGQDEAVVGDTLVDELNRRFEIIEESVHVFLWVCRKKGDRVNAKSTMSLMLAITQRITWLAHLLAIP
jgi:hypothetical protein